MALLFQKESSAALYLVPREGMIAPFDLGSDWTEIRCGMYLSGCSADNENANDSFSELTPVSDVSDLITFGIKNSDDPALPGEANSLFVGIKTGVTDGNNTGYFVQPSGLNPGVVGSSIAGTFCGIGYDGTNATPNAPGELMVAAGMVFPAISGATGYCGFYALKFVITNRGLPTQYFTISCSKNPLVAGFDYSPNAIGAEMSSASYLPGVDIQWNDGASAREIPNAVWLRTPFYRNRLMIAAMRVIKYQPQ